MADNITRIGYPVPRTVLRRHLARQNVCPECGGALDTGWECNDCDYDAMIEATTTEPLHVISVNHLRRACERELAKPRKPR